MTTQLLAIILLIGIIIGYFKVKKYLSWIKEEKGYKPYNGINIVLIIAIFLLPALHIYGTNAEGIGIVDVLLFLTPYAVLVYRNLKIGDPLHIVLVSIFQVLFALAFVFAMMALFILSVSGGGSGSRNPRRTYSTGYNRNSSTEIDYRIMEIQQSWVGHEADYDRAREFGYNTPEEAMEAGFKHDGTRIYDSNI